MLHFLKVIQLGQTRNETLISYCENAVVYYNTTATLSIKEGKKKNNAHKNLKNNLQTI